MPRAAADPWLAAVRAIPRGQTLTFAELAARAGRPGAARAAGRVVRLAQGDAPWHRVVPASGVLPATQLARLRAEGARPRAGESVVDWAARRGVRLVAHVGRRGLLAAGDPRAQRWPAHAVEACASRVQARARAFRSPDGHDEAAPPLPRGERRAATPLAQRVARLDAEKLARTLARRGVVRSPALLAPAECAALAARFDDDALFERTVVMAPRGFGVGEYRYFREPPPPPVAALRRGLWARLARRVDPALPRALAAFHARCRAAGQRRGSCILLRYAAGGVNHPHRDVYGPVAAPLQALVMLSRRGRDFAGGSFFVDGEDGRRRAVPASQGDLVVFRSALRHGMTPVTRGGRYALGIVFHLAR